MSYERHAFGGFKDHQPTIRLRPAPFFGVSLLWFGVRNWRVGGQELRRSPAGDAGPIHALFRPHRRVAALGSIMARKIHKCKDFYAFPRTE